MNGKITLKIFVFLMAIASTSAITVPTSAQNGNLPDSSEAMAESNLSDMTLSLDALPPEDVADPLSLITEFFFLEMSPEEEAQAIENRVAQCMQAKGWKYEPFTGTFQDGWRTIGELREHRIERGYASEENPPSTRPINPNDKIISKFSSEQFQEYLQAMWGPDGGRSESRLPDIPGPEEKGCRPSAERAVRINEPLYDEALTLFLQKNHIMTHPRFQAGENAWLTCLNNHGLKFTDRGELNAVVEKLSENSPGTASWQRQLDIAKIDFACYMKHLRKVQQATERALLSLVAKQFPKYTARVHETLCPPRQRCSER